MMDLPRFLARSRGIRSVRPERRQAESSRFGLLPTEMRRLKLLEDENAKLHKLVADLLLDREMLQDVIRRKI